MKSGYNGYTQAEILHDGDGYFVRLWNGEDSCDEPVGDSTRRECVEFISENGLEMIGGAR